MLSPHELATLMLVRSAPDQIDTARVELDTLLDYRLISLEPRVGGWRRPMLTPAGVHLLDAAARLERQHARDALTREDDNLL
ncbi:MULTISPECIES: hypothetical protein [Paraburkholderia]|jgi:hypothetical protein|uniref:Uncharacterized protein n=1 Tax=Paraburkholderia largidicola TaxID=3014751 RepID=A0A7I8BRK3_9BURK|nr:MULTISPECIES: hypothetical protein [Paraburkholderia]BCF90979.1 hypothetical protein PPGU16_40460 [Paraburkholderia sp. PGU16]GJH03422.1 hypothetical protein CBA19C8_22715 [Paraburkholderia terrae]GJH32943.1 hypothetical protein CBA19CS91_09320 [Paraburkholderia hospita]CAG9270066.1 conserved hypothetical protein [Paraburkholderia caribensis]